MRTSQRLTLGAVLISGMSLMAYPAAAASFQTFTSVNSNLPDHFFPYLIGEGSQVPPAPATAEQATITAPLVAPAGETYAWVMSTDLQTWTQVGLAWPPGASEPYIFSDSSTLSPDYVEGPSIPPGGSVTVRLVLKGSENVSPQPSTWVTEYWSTSGWQVIQTAKVTGELTPPTVEEYYSGNVARQNWLFRWVGYFDGAWHHMAASAQGAGAPDA